MTSNPLPQRHRRSANAAAWHTAQVAPNTDHLATVSNGGKFGESSLRL